MAHKRTKRLTGEALIERMADFAVASGAERQKPTNMWEIVRLRVNGGVAIVYRNAKGQHTWNDFASQIRTVMDSGLPFPDSLRLKAKTPNNPKGRIEHDTLIERDGYGCFFCGEEVEGEMNIEHLVARTFGGPNHLSNKFRACRPHNEMAGHMSAPEKIAMRDRIRAQKPQAA